MQDSSGSSTSIRFIAVVFLIAAGLLTTIVGFVVLIDPYNVWRIASIHKFNAIKLEVPFPAQMSAAVWSSAMHSPDVLILGSSRVRRGFSEAEASRILGSKVMVAGIDVMTPEMARDAFVNIGKKNHIKKLYLEVNYFASSDCDGVSKRYQIDSYADDSLRRIILGNAVAQSIRTLRLNLFAAPASSAYFNEGGVYTYMKSSVGRIQNLDDAQQVIFQNFLEKIRSSCKRDPNNDADFRALEDIFKLAKANRTEVLLLVLPSSERWQARLRHGQFQSTLAQWKSNISRQALRFNSRLLDLEYYGELQQADPANNGSAMFWDDTHFTNSLGNRLLAHIANADRARSAVPVLSANGARAP